MRAPLIIFSGLPGTGKTTLASWLADELDLALLRIDDIVEANAGESEARNQMFWGKMIDLLLRQVERQINEGTGVIVDSVFMGADRSAVSRLARQHGLAFYAIHTLCSDEELWRARLEDRRQRYPQDDPATWEQVSEQRKHFLPWDPADALFVDAADPLETNKLKVLKYLKARS